LLIDFLGVGRCSSASRFCCGEAPEREEREARLVKRGEEAVWRSVKEDDGLLAEFAVGGVFMDVGDGRAAALRRRSCERKILFMVLLRSSGSVLFVAWEATEGDRVEVGDFGEGSILARPRSRRGMIQEEVFSQDVCPWWKGMRK
jgi:hypothetical protein